MGSRHNTIAMPQLPTLPIVEIVSELQAALGTSPCVVLEAPPGAGKTTYVPLALLDQPWLAGASILMLEPRRLAARAAAARMAQTLGQAVGEVVGYRVRLDSKISARTCIEVVTEGILTRRLQDDPGLEGVGLVIFDEFHERSLNSDIGLALCLDAQAGLRDDLKILVMSATLDGDRVAQMLGGAPILRSRGRAFPVETRFCGRNAKARFEDDMAAAIRRALAEETGSLLAFLPGEGEIRRVAERLDGLGPDIVIAPLYGALPPQDQDRAIKPVAAGLRKVVLATTIAETSLTIEGIRIVVDGGLKRVPRFDANSGMTRLDSVKVSRASAEQRRGRAGRLEPGLCYRLWSEAEDRALAAYDAPEMSNADLAPLMLDLAQWGVSDPAELAWLDPPPTGSASQAVALLQRLDGLDEQGRITPLGKRMAALPLHPRLAHMVLKGAEMGQGGLACDIAALLSEGDFLRFGPADRDVDLRPRLDILNGAKPPRNASLRQGMLSRVREGARQLRRLARIGSDTGERGRAGAILALAYPDRIGQLRGGRGRFRLSGGRGAVLPESDPLAAEDFLVVADLDGQARDARIFLACPLARAELDEVFADHLESGAFVEWDGRAKAVQARRQTRFGALILKDELCRDRPPDQVVAAMVSGIRQMGLECLPWSPEARNFQARIAFLARIEKQGEWPDCSDAALEAGLEDWLGPFLAGIASKAQLDRLDLMQALENLLPWERRQELDRDAPTHLAVPTGSRLKVDYTGDAPMLAVRLQEMFGCGDTPRIAKARVPVVLHLLSPARRPLAVTKDLAGFWNGAYAEVRAEMRGRYPKHYWPDNPLDAEPTRRAKPKG